MTPTIVPCTAFLEARGLVKPTTLPPTLTPALPPQPQNSERKRRIETKKEDPEYEIDETDEETDERIQELEVCVFFLIDILPVVAFIECFFYGFTG